VVTLDGAVDLPPEGRGSVSSALAGTITAVRAGRGQSVRAGDVVAEVYSPELLTLQLELIRASLEHRLETDTLTRIRSVPAIAGRRVWEAESRVASLRAQVDAFRRKLVAVGLAEAQVDAVVDKRQVVTTVPVRAPLAGVVVTFDKALGQAIAAREVLFEIHDSARAGVQGFVPEQDASRVTVGRSVRVRLVADPGVVRTGRIVRSGRIVGVDSRVQSIWVEFDTRPETPLCHQQLADLSVVVGSHSPTVTVPLGAIADEGSFTFVFVRRPDGVFERRSVDLGPADDRRVVITRGLVAGEPVAVSGVGELAAGFASLK
jgi:RND family efflux transporter MFP subunit